MAKANYSFEFFDHTADIGFHLHAKEKQDLLLAGAEALYEVIGNLCPVINGKPVIRSISLTGETSEHILQQFLSELLYLFECQSLIATNIIVSEFSDTALNLSLECSNIDFAKSELAHEVKAVSLHGMEISCDNSGFHADVIVDI